MDKTSELVFIREVVDKRGNKALAASTCPIRIHYTNPYLLLTVLSISTREQRRRGQAGGALRTIATINNPSKPKPNTIFNPPTHLHIPNKLTQLHQKNSQGKKFRKPLPTPHKLLTRTLCAWAVYFSRERDGDDNSFSPSVAYE